jgi:uncharacterized low-complexity protein
MSKHAADTASTTKKFLAAGGLAFGVASLGLFAGPGTAAADGHTINDKIATWPCGEGKCSSSGSAEGAQDVGEQRGADEVAAIEAHDTSADSPHDNFWTANNKPTTNNLPVASYPATASWPDNTWGVNDRG